MLGSDRFSLLDTRDRFLHFLLQPDSQELFMFHADGKIYKLKVLAMGTTPASG